MSSEIFELIKSSAEVSFGYPDGTVGRQLEFPNDNFGVEVQINDDCPDVRFQTVAVYVQLYEPTWGLWRFS